MLEFKEGQTYICLESDYPWWTEGKEYKVVRDELGILNMLSDGHKSWYASEINMLKHTIKFKLKEDKITEGKEIIILDTELNNGLEVSVWRNIDEGVFEVTVVDPRDIWNYSRDEIVRTEQEVVNVLARLNKEVL